MPPNKNTDVQEQKRPNHKPSKDKVIDPAELDRSFYTVYEVADMMRIHWQTVLRMIRKGELPAKKYGRAWRIRVDDLIAFTTPDNIVERKD